MERKFIDYEVLICDICGDKFNGRRPGKGGSIKCPKCLNKEILIEIKVNDILDTASNINEEFIGGDEDGEKTEK